MRLLLLISLLVLPLFGVLLPSGRPNLAALNEGPRFPNGVVACGATFCDAERCVETREEDGVKKYECRVEQNEEN